MSGHLCHLPGCKIPVPEKRLFCLRHWLMVPKSLQARVWATYRKGQENDKLPSPAYMEARQAAIDAVLKIRGAV